MSDYPSEWAEELDREQADDPLEAPDLPWIIKTRTVTMAEIMDMYGDSPACPAHEKRPTAD